MYAHCLACDLRFEREHGYFVGAIYINYAVTAVMAIAGYFILGLLVDMAPTYRVILWGSFAMFFPLFFFRYARSLWLSFDYMFNPENAHDERGP